MVLKKNQLKHHKRRGLLVGGVWVPAYNFWYGGGEMTGGLTMATNGNQQHEAQETPEQESGEDTSAATTGANAAGGDASAGAAQSAM